MAVSVSLSLTELAAGVAKEVSMRGPNLLLGKRGSSCKNPPPFLNLRSPHSRDFRGKLPPLPRSTERSTFFGSGDVLPESGKTRSLGGGGGRELEKEKIRSHSKTSYPEGLIQLVGSATRRCERFFRKSDFQKSHGLLWRIPFGRSLILLHNSAR